MPQSRHFAAAGLIACALIIVQVTFARVIGYELFYLGTPEA